ncbi:unnamed protein product [Somion occarium]|uniref:BTB domain-containing protein n=1 Tax=Somion occarium TaxID=3059160 RepID=A0ABP1DII6_9APHY
MTATDIDVSLAEKFQFEDADVIIRAGGANFSAHKLILSLASPVFKHIFSLPRNESSQEGVPIVEVTEDAQSIHDVLSLLYPNIDDPNISDLIVMHRVLLALRKYEMLKLKARMARRLERAAWGKSARIFAIACHAGLADTARAAAQGTLLLERNTLITSVIPENKKLSAETFQKLLRYHIECGEVAQAQAEVQAGVTQNVARSDWLWLRFQSDECPEPLIRRHV